MNFLIMLILVLILGETSFLVLKNRRPLSTKKRKIYIDTSALIDGRILDVARSGFLDGEIIVLKSVLRELQLLADGKDSEKRTRARAGLDVVSELERTLQVNTEILDDGEGKKKVDDELLKYAKENHGVVLTIDYNLIKVAEAEKIPTLNINELALAVKTEFTPGDRAEVKITEKGSNPGQGVGHLASGVMVVVDNAASRVGETLPVRFVRLHETESGRIIFAKVARRKKRE